MTIRRFWIEFDTRVVGVSATDREDALNLLKDKVFGGRELPAVHTLIEDVDVSTLDANHVIPNMGNVLVCGIWFPPGLTPESRLSW